MNSVNPPAERAALAAEKEHLAHAYLLLIITCAIITTGLAVYDHWFTAAIVVLAIYFPWKIYRDVSTAASELQRPYDLVAWHVLFPMKSGCIKFAFQWPSSCNTLYVQERVMVAANEALHDCLSNDKEEIKALLTKAIEPEIDEIGTIPVIRIRFAGAEWKDGTEDAGDIEISE